MLNHTQNRADINASVTDSAGSAASPYITSDLETASYLVASGYPVRHAEPLPNGKIIRFHFDPDAHLALTSYFSGALLPARELFRAHRDLRHMCKQVKIHAGVTNNVYQPR